MKKLGFYFVFGFLVLLIPACALLGASREAPPAKSTAVRPRRTPAPTPLPLIGPRATQPAEVQRPKRNVATEADVQYYPEPPGADPRSTSLDIYVPQAGENYPVMIFVHGGGWQKGDKGNVLYKPSAFNAEGYIFISMNYRQVPEVDVPAQAGDIARAIAWVYAHAADYGGDPQRIFLMGHSAGAHLVSLVGTDPTYLEAEELSLANLSGVVSLDTQTYDIPGLMSIPVQPGGRIYRQAFGSDPQLWEQLSPYYYITEDSGMPPFQVAYTGSGEERAEQSERFVQALQDAGILAELLPAEEKTHTEINREFGMPGDAVTQAVFEFLNKLAYGGEE